MKPNDVTHEVIRAGLIVHSKLGPGLLENDGIKISACSIPLPASAFERFPALRSYEGKMVVFGIRPEDLHDSNLARGPQFAAVPGVVRSTEELGAELIVHLNIDAVRVDSGDPDAVEDLSGAANAVARFEAASVVQQGEKIDLALDATKLHFFDPQTHVVI